MNIFVCGWYFQTKYIPIRIQLIFSNRIYSYSYSDDIFKPNIFVFVFGHGHRTTEQMVWSILVCFWFCHNSAMHKWVESANVIWKRKKIRSFWLKWKQTITSPKVSGKTNCSVLDPPGAKTNKELSRQNLKFKITTEKFAHKYIMKTSIINNILSRKLGVLCPMKMKWSENGTQSLAFWLIRLMMIEPGCGVQKNLRMIQFGEKIYEQIFGGVGCGAGSPKTPLLRMIQFSQIINTNILGGVLTVKYSNFSKTLPDFYLRCVLIVCCILCIR